MRSLNGQITNYKFIMNILVTGSIAFDRIAVFKDRFARHILPEKTHQINVSFGVDNLTVHRGGTGGNIAYNLALLGASPYLAGTVGNDFGDYQSWLERNGVRLDYIKTLPEVLTAQASIMTDLDDNQITAFYGGAMFRAEEARVEGLSPIDLAIIAPNGTTGMLYYADHFKRHRIPFIADPGQAIPALSKEQLETLINGAILLIANDYEWALIAEKTGWTREDILNKVKYLIVTYGEKGSQMWSRRDALQCVSEPVPVHIPVFPPQKVIDPTGCGDAYRAGLMWGIVQKWPLQKAATLGSWMASKAIAHQGTQNHTIDPEELHEFMALNNP